MKVYNNYLSCSHWLLQTIAELNNQSETFGEKIYIWLDLYESVVFPTSPPPAQHIPFLKIDSKKAKKYIYFKTILKNNFDLVIIVISTVCV